MERTEDRNMSSTNVSGGIKLESEKMLNIVLCGSDKSLKNYTSKLIRGQNRKDKHLINVVELPVLTGLSDEEMMCQTIDCLSLCHPGVHMFLVIIPDALLSDEHKAEVKEILKTFSSRINPYLITVIIKDLNLSGGLVNKIHDFNSSAPETCQLFEGHRFVLEISSQTTLLLQDVERMVLENSERCYTIFMYLQAQIDLERNKHKTEIEELRGTTAGVTHSEDDGLRIVLLGKTGVGKSASGNTIMRRSAFNSQLKPGSVTKVCQKETSQYNRRNITVIDTPGLFDTTVDNVDTIKEIVKCVSMASPGPHVFLLVISLSRFTQEEKEAVKIIQDTFGDKSRMYTIVLFTRGDDLNGTTIEEFFKDNEGLQSLLRKCENRYHVFDNKECIDHSQVSELLDKIELMVAANGGSFYTNEMFQLVEMNIKEEHERIIKEKEEEIRKKEDELKAKYEAETEKIKKGNEREREEMLEELKRRDAEFKIKEKEIEKQTDDIVRKEMQRKLDEQQKGFEKENKEKVKALEEQNLNNIKKLNEKHESMKKTLTENIQKETREQAEKEYSEKLCIEVTKALQKSENDLTNRSRMARDWSFYGSFVGSTAGGLIGSAVDIGRWIAGLLKHQHQT